MSKKHDNNLEYPNLVKGMLDLLKRTAVNMCPVKMTSKPNVFPDEWPSWLDIVCCLAIILRPGIYYSNLCFTSFARENCFPLNCLNKLIIFTLNQILNGE